jgi:hypothetical protein
MSAKFSVVVDIGARVGSSVASSIGATESRFKAFASRMGHLNHSVAGQLLEVGGAAAVARKAIGAGAALASETQHLRNVGRTYEELAEVMQKAAEVSFKLPTTTLAENLKMVSETTNAYGNLHHALENLEFGQKLSSNIKAASEGKIQGSAAEMMNKFVRVFEMRGTAGNSAVFQKEASEVAKAMIAFRGNFNPDELLGFAQQANPAIKTLSERFLSRVAPTMIQEFGGDRAGTRLQAFENVISGKVRDKTQTAEWMKMGLVDPSMLRGGKGSPIAWKSGAVKDTNLAMTDPDIWAEKVLLPALQKHGVNVGDQLALSRQLSTMFRNGESNRFANAIAQAMDRQRLQNDASNIGKVHDKDSIYSDNLKKDPHVAFGALETSLSSFLSVLTGPLMVPAAAGLGTLAEGIGKVASVLSERPNIGGTAGAAAGGFLAYQTARAAIGLVRAGNAFLGLPAALTANTAATVANTGAMATSLTGVGAGLTGRMALGALGIGTIGTIAGVAAYTTYKGMGGGNTEWQNRVTREMAGLNQKIAVYDNLIGTGQAGPNTQTKRDAAQTRFDELKRQLEVAGEDAGKGASKALADGFNVEGFKVKGAAAGVNTTGGFLGSDFSGAGREAGQSLLSGFGAAMKNLSPTLGQDMQGAAGKRASNTVTTHAPINLTVNASGDSREIERAAKRAVVAALDEHTAAQRDLLTD